MDAHNSGGRQGWRWGWEQTDVISTLYRMVEGGGRKSRVVRAGSAVGGSGLSF